MKTKEAIEVLVNPIKKWLRKRETETRKTIIETSIKKYERFLTMYPSTRLMRYSFRKRIEQLKRELQDHIVDVSKKVD